MDGRNLVGKRTLQRKYTCYLVLPKVGSLDYISTGRNSGFHSSAYQLRRPAMTEAVVEDLSRYSPNKQFR